MYKKRRRVGHPDARKRSCFECGRGPLPGRYRYVPGSRWWENGVPFARCLNCKDIARGPKDQTVTECLSCYREQIREWTAKSELQNAHREAREEEERLQRRWAWIGRGFALSDYESSDDEDEDEWELRQIYSEMYF